MERVMGWICVAIAWCVFSRRYTAEMRISERRESGGGGQAIVFCLRRRINEHAAKTLSSRVEGSGTDTRTKVP
jgi:hypothetical protein